MHKFSKLLHNELICALGCTEPIALAFASSQARDVLGSMPEIITVFCSGNIIKNVKGVTVPNTGGMKGIESAVAIGLTAGKTEKGLEVISDATQEDMRRAKEIVESGIISVMLKEGIENLDIEINMQSGNDSVDVEIKNKHTNVVKIVKNGKSIVEEDALSVAQDESFYEGMTLKSIFNYANSIDLKETEEIINRQIAYNTEISKEGLTNEWGSGIGSILFCEDDSIRNIIKAKAAAGSDARMSGCSMPVVINAGSGNQGMTCSIPVIEYAEKYGKNKEQLHRALLISNLIALHIKRYIGRLSAFCGVTSAGVGAAAAMAYLEKSSYDLIEKTVGNTLMICSGMICDGAKPSCAAKIASAVDAGYTGFSMALKGRNFQPGDGLLKEDIEETIRSIGHVAKEGMRQTDIEVLKEMIK